MADADEAGYVRSNEPSPHIEKRPTMFKAVSTKVAEYHGKVPGIRKLPFSAAAIIIILIAANVCVWIAAGVVLVYSYIETRRKF